MKIRKKRYSILLVIVFCCILLVTILQLIADNKIRDYLDRKIPSHIDLKYDDLDVNIITGDLRFHNLSADLYNRDTSIIHTSFKADLLALDGLGYWQFFVKETIDLNEIILDHPEVTYMPDRKFARKDTVERGVVNLLKTIIVDKLRIDHGVLQVVRDSQENHQLEIRDINFTLSDAKIDSQIITRKIPIVYSDYSFSAYNIFVDLGPFETLTADAFTIEENEISIQDIHMKSKYGKRELSKKLKEERDYISMTIPEIIFKNAAFGFKKERFYVTSSEGIVKSPNMELYRDKLVADDLSSKPLYGEILRNLPINLDISELSITDGYLGYEELIDIKAPPGRIFFDKLTSKFSNISNQYGPEGLTTMQIRANLMGNAPITLDYSFNCTNPSDTFTASGSIKGFNGSSVNSYLMASLRTEAEGMVDQMYFTISGDAVSSSGNIKMMYRDFKLEILKKDLLKVNKVLTAIGNLFINDGSKSDEDGFRYGNIAAERDVNKSFFNYLWLNVRNGIVSTLTGDGKKKT